jgi:hypothetical protein
MSLQSFCKIFKFRNFFCCLFSHVGPIELAVSDAPLALRGPLPWRPTFELCLGFGFSIVENSLVSLQGDGLRREFSPAFSIFIILFACATVQIYAHCGRESYPDNCWAA